MFDINGGSDDPFEIAVRGNAVSSLPARRHPDEGRSILHFRVPS